jgi:hypothetical protein
MKCQKCDSDRVLNVSGKCSDMCSYSLKGQEADGYVPDDMGVGGGDYLEVNVCLDCGQLQGEWPLPKTELEKESEMAELDPFKEGDYVEFDYHGCTLVGIVESYDRDRLEVEIEAHGSWNENTSTIGELPRRSGPRPSSRIYCLDQNDVKKTDKEW